MNKFSDGPGWDVEDIELPKDLAEKFSEVESKDAAYFNAPIKGTSQLQVWTHNSQLAVDHVRAGSYETAMRLLNNQVGIVNFEPYKQIFSSLYLSARTVYISLPDLPVRFSHPHRNWKEAGVKNGLPTLGFKLNDLLQSLQVSLREFSL